jgi:DNA-binding winged helix-turn-helix (wHTH) protein
MFYLIDDTLEFRPNSLTIINLENPTVPVNLPAPASCCLLYLIENSPNIVTQNDLINNVWGNEGMLIPKNTLYQNISIIRREIRRTGYNKKIITTVSRKGFVISGVIINKGVKQEGIIPKDVCHHTGVTYAKNKPRQLKVIIGVLFINAIPCQSFVKLVCRHR